MKQFPIWFYIVNYNYHRKKDNIPNLIVCNYEGEEYYMLQGYLSSKKVGKKAFREVWMQVRTYLYIKDKKKFLLEFLEENNLDVVWTVLGEKQKITGGFGREFPGRAEFSYTYYINEKEVSRNHKMYNMIIFCSA
jgi:hypothetical protein